jgi:hypothetical protein
MGKVMTIDRLDFQRGVNDIYTLKPLRRAILAASKEVAGRGFVVNAKRQSGGATVVKSARGTERK